jgi:membrane fusion protein, multidrug efflux system
MEDGSQAAEKRPGAPAANSARKRAMRLWALTGVVLVLGALLGWWLHARQYETTDDAQVDANISAVSSRVPGTVTAVRVVDNQEVKTGDALVELDPSDLRVALAQARASLAQAEAQLAAEHPSMSITSASNRASVEAAEAAVATARTDMEAASRDLEQATASDHLAQLQLARGKVLLAGGSITQADHDQLVAAAKVAAAATAAAREHLRGRSAMLESALARQTEIRQNAPRQMDEREASVHARAAELDLARARLEKANLDLSYTTVVAPADGIAGRRSVNVGDRIQPGQQLFALTQTGDAWVIANFRETQIRWMRAGQPVKVHVDALSLDYRGTVESFAGATGSRYSLFPPENATGSYVKVVQRLPVRIRLEPGQPGMDRLRPGMSVEAEVRIR